MVATVSPNASPVLGPITSPSTVPPLNRVTSKTHLVGPAVLAESHNAKKTGCANFLSLLKSLTFPVSWVILRIIDLVKLIFKCCGEMDRTVTITEPVHSTTSHGLASIPEITPPSTPVSDPDKVRKLVSLSTTLITNITNLDRVFVPANNALEMLQGSPGSTPQGLTLVRFFEVIQIANDQIQRLKSCMRDHEAYCEKYETDFASIKKELISDELNEQLNHNVAAVNAKKEASVEIITKSNALFSKWEAFLKAHRDALIDRFGTYQQLIIKTFDELPSKNVGSSDPKKQGLGIYNDYLKLFKVMNSLSIATQDSPAHVVIMQHRVDFSDAIGLKNPSVFCWRNSALQAMRGVEEICNRIKNLKEPPRLPAETEDQYEARLCTLRANPPGPQRAAETYDAFEKRVQSFENRYPVQRSAEVEKMVYDARMAAYEKLPSKEGVAQPQRREPETEAAFRERLAKFNLRDFITEWRKSSYKEERFAGWLKDREVQYMKDFKRDNFATNNVLEPISAETDVEYKTRLAKYDSDLKRKMESDETMKNKQKFLDALKAVWNAWETDESSLESALEQLQKEIFNGISPSFKATESNDQLDSGDFLAVVFEVLGLSNEMLLLNESKPLNAESRKVQPSCIIELPMTGDAAKINDIQGLIQQWAVPRQGEAPWNVSPKNPAVTDYTTTCRIISDPQPVMLLRLSRKHSGDQIADAQSVQSMKNWEYWFKAIESQLHRKPSAALKASALAKFAEELAGPDKMDRPISIPEDCIVDLAPFFSEKVVDSCGGQVKARIQALTRHEDGGAGRGESGHFVGYRKDKTTGQWRYFSDKTVVVKSNDEMFKGSKNKAPEIFEGFTFIVERVI